MIFIGIDPSLTATGIVGIQNSVPTKGDLNFEDSSWSSTVVLKKLVTTNKKDCIEKRLSDILLEIKDIIRSPSSSIVSLEGLSFQSRGKSLAQLAGLHYTIRNYFYKKNIIFNIVPPTLLKKFVTGRGNAKKNLMLLSVYKKWNVEFTDDNLADAFSLAQYGMQDFYKNL